MLLHVLLLHSNKQWRVKNNLVVPSFFLLLLLPSQSTKELQQLRQLATLIPDGTIAHFVAQTHLLAPLSKGQPLTTRRAVDGGVTKIMLITGSKTGFSIGC